MCEEHERFVIRVTESFDTIDYRLHQAAVLSPGSSTVQLERVTTSWRGPSRRRGVVRWVQGSNDAELLDLRSIFGVFHQRTDQPHHIIALGILTDCDLAIQKRSVLDQLLERAAGASEAGESLRVAVEVLDEHVDELIGEGMAARGSAEDVIVHCRCGLWLRVESAV